jgi:hypothetical protein
MDSVESMAYLRKEEETVEVDYSLAKVWLGIQQVLTTLEWSAEQVNETEHQIKAKTKAGSWSFSSIILINLTPVNENTTRVSVKSETPVTMIIGIIDFAQGKRRIAQFFAELAKQLTS